MAAVEALDVFAAGALREAKGHRSANGAEHAPRLRAVARFQRGHAVCGHQNPQAL